MPPDSKPGAAAAQSEAQLRTQAHVTPAGSHPWGKTAPQTRTHKNHPPASTDQAASAAAKEDHSSCAQPCHTAAIGGCVIKAFVGRPTRTKRIHSPLLTHTAMRYKRRDVSPVAVPATPLDLLQTPPHTIGVPTPPRHWQQRRFSNVGWHTASHRPYVLQESVVTPRITNVQQAKI